MKKNKRETVVKNSFKDIDAATKNQKISSTVIRLLAYTDQTELPLFV
jgi:hypothetical protein